MHREVFGVECNLCGCQDSEQDNIIPSMRRAWGHPAGKTTGRNVGNLCLICFRVYRARFRGKYANGAILKAAFGADPNVYALWKHWWDICEESMKR